MRELKGGAEDLVSLSPARRLRKFKWWFLVLLLLGILALVGVLVFNVGESVKQIQKGSLDFLLISYAYAQNGADKASQVFTPRIIIITGVFAILGIVYVAAIIKLFFTRNADQVDAASDLVKTLTGFFVGAATSYLG